MLGGAFLFFWIRARYHKDVYRRLEEPLTHKQFRGLMAELRKRYSSFKAVTPPLKRLPYAPLHIEREYLAEDMLPETLNAVRNIMPTVCAGTVLCAAAGAALKSGPFAVVSYILLAASVIMAAVYCIVERRSSAVKMPKMSKRERRLGSKWKFSADSGKPYTQREKKVIRQAFVLRYGIAPALPFLAVAAESRIAAFIAGTVILADGANTLYHYRSRSDAMYCAEQDLCRQTMTPFRHSDRLEKRAVRDFRFMFLLELIVGALIVVSVIISALTDL